MDLAPGSCLATSLGLRTQGHMAGSEREAGLSIPAWWPRRPLLPEARARMSFLCTGEGRGPGRPPLANSELCASGDPTPNAIELLLPPALVPP